MPHPVFSFLTSAYRTERYIAETIESVLAQTRSDWELIVVDNGNSDEMARIVANYTCDERIKLVRQENKGVRGGVRAAAEAAVGMYLCPIDSDDLLEPAFCERVGALLDAEPTIDAVGSDGELFRDPDDGSATRGLLAVNGRRSVPDPSRSVSLGELLDEGVPSYVGAFRRETWDAHEPFDPAASHVEPDVSLWLSLAAAGRDIRILPDRLARLRVRPDSMSHGSSSIEEFEHRLLQSFFEICKYYPLTEDEVSRSRVVRRLRHDQGMRRAKWALNDGDVQGARAAATRAYRDHKSLRCAAAVVALWISPRTLRSLHPAIKRTRNALLRARFHASAGVGR